MTYPDGEVVTYGYNAAGQIESLKSNKSGKESVIVENVGYITDDNANITQYDAYLPYGELLVDEHNSSEEMPYKFNGKEMDEETGLYYYGARYMNPAASMFLGVDPLAEKYPSIGGYVYCAGNPVKLVDPDGKGWIKTKSTMYFNPKVHSQEDISKHDHERGFTYVGETYNAKDASYRSDGSVLFKNETSAYKYMWYNANTLWRTKKNKWGREVGGFILKNGSVLVLPDYNNNETTSEISAYGYKINGSNLKHGKENFTILGQIHTHQAKSFDPTPSGIISNYTYSIKGDVLVSKELNGLPVLTLGHDGNVYGCFWTNNRPTFIDKGQLGVTRTDLLDNNLKLVPILKKIFLK